MHQVASIAPVRNTMLQRIGRGVVSMLRPLGSLLPHRNSSDAPTTRVIRPWRDDSFHSYPSVGLTPSRALSFIQQADGGLPQMQFELFAEMLQKWPRLAAVENTRRLALTGLEWEIAPALSHGSRQAGAPSPESVVDFCRESLASLDRFRDVLDHMALAIGFGISVAELVWEDGRLIDIVPVPHSRLVADANEPWRMRIRTEDDPSVGVALDEHPAKWIVHTPTRRPGRHFDGGVLRASVLLYVAQNLSFKDWLIYSQIAGMPVRVAQFEPGTPEADKRELLKMLEAMGTDAVAAFSKSIDLQFIDGAGKGARPYEPLQDYCNTEITILWLGQSLTTDIRGEGSRAAAEIHDRVREDLLVDDIADEAATIRRDVLRPIVQARFGDGAAAPVFRRSLVESVDTRVLAETLAVAVKDLGMSVPARWVHRALGIPEPAADEAVLNPASQELRS